jgi:transcriptional regulator of arginine metabolism
MGRFANKTERHDLIREIVKNVRLETQTDLVAALRKNGVDCTQATVSRDIKEMKLAKTQTDDGAYFYADPGGGEQPVVGKLLDAFSNGFVRADYSANIVVIKTIAGLAPACAYAIDAVQWPETVGTLAGEDTILIVTKSVSASKKIIRKIETLLI